MGSLVDEGKAAFEDHVIDRYPGFQMYDPWVTREFMIWDLMAQHSGMSPTRETARSRSGSRFPLRRH